MSSLFLHSFLSFPDDIFLHNIFFLIKCVDLYKFKYLNKAYNKILTLDLFKKNIIFHLDKKLSKIFGADLELLKKKIEEDNYLITGRIILESIMGKKKYEQWNEKVFKIPKINLHNSYKIKILKDVILEKYFEISKYENNVNEIKEIINDYNSGIKNSDKKKIYWEVFNESTISGQNNLEITFINKDSNLEKKEVINFLNNSLYFSKKYKSRSLHLNNQSHYIYYNQTSKIKYVRTIALKINMLEKIKIINLLVNFYENIHNILSIMFNKNYYMTENGIGTLKIFNFKNLMELDINLVDCSLEI